MSHALWLEGQNRVARRDWLRKRRRLEAKYGIRTFAVYATADFGVIGFENGRRMAATRFIRIVSCRSATR